MAEKFGDESLLMYDKKRDFLDNTLETEAEEKVANNNLLLDTIFEKIAVFNQSVFAINGCLRNAIV